MAPFEKQGGLGDVLGALPKNLNKSGRADARVLLPAYPGVFSRVNEKACRMLPDKVNAAVDWRVLSADVYETKHEGVTVYLLDAPDLFNDPKVYPTHLDSETLLPFVFLSYAALELPKIVGWEPEIYHVHDWSSALLPIALKHHRYYKRLADKYDTVCMIHNLAHQGLVDPSCLIGWGLDSSAYSIDCMEFYGQGNLLKGAALTSDAIVTVSPHYSWDIQTGDGGFGLHGVFSEHGHLYGILNGIDYDVWSPEHDKTLAATYSKNDISGKTVCRAALLEHCGWAEDDRPILLFVGRLVEQKGVDIMLRMLENGMLDQCRAVVIGGGSSQFEGWCRYLRDTRQDSFWYYTGFDEPLAHRAYAGADILVMPSLFEPCGLSQMIAMSYGTVPVVRSTGGLADSVIDFDGSADGTGFIFSDYSADELARAVWRAVVARRDHARWSRVMENAMRADMSWKQSIEQYLSMYDDLKKGE